nr:hypothetical protein [Angustibacter aerolatus]
MRADVARRRRDRHHEVTGRVAQRDAHRLARVGRAHHEGAGLADALAHGLDDVLGEPGPARDGHGDQAGGADVHR